MLDILEEQLPEHWESPEDVLEQLLSVIRDEKSIISFCEWGEGHAVPQKNLIELVLMKITERVDLKNIAECLESGFDGVLDKPRPLVWFNTDKQFHIETKAFFENTGIRAQVAINPAGKGINSISYAFYLLKNDPRIAQRWYEPKSEVFFNMDHFDGKLEVVAFAQDQLGFKLTSRTPVSG